MSATVSLSCEMSATIPLSSSVQSPTLAPKPIQTGFTKHVRYQQSGWGMSQGETVPIKHSCSARYARNLDQSVTEQGGTDPFTYGGILVMSRVRLAQPQVNVDEGASDHTATDMEWKHFSPWVNKGYEEGSMAIVREDKTSDGSSVSITIISGIIGGKIHRTIRHLHADKMVSERKVFTSSTVTSCRARRQDIPSMKDKATKPMRTIRKFLQVRRMHGSGSKLRILALSQHPKTSGFDEHWSSGAEWDQDSLNTFPVQKVVVTVHDRDCEKTSTDASAEISACTCRDEHLEIIELHILPLLTQVKQTGEDSSETITVSAPLMGIDWSEDMKFRWLDHKVVG